MSRRRPRQKLQPRLEAQTVRRLALGLAYGVALVGLLWGGLHLHIFSDEWAIVGVAIGGLIALAAAVVLDIELAWLVVSAAFIYAAAIGAQRATDGRVLFYVLIFGGYALGAIASYVASMWEVA
jgi:hypothetical protein